MKTRLPTLVVLTAMLAAASPPPAVSAQAEDTPVESDLEEEVGVRLVLVDTVVLDRAGRTVAGLTKDDFELVVDGKHVPVDTLDMACPSGGMNDPQQVRRVRNRPPIPAPKTGRRIVLVLDYLHLDLTLRPEVIDQARAMVRHSMAPGDEVMIAALGGGLRIEQVFTWDKRELERTLERMEYDISLWNGNFSHLTELPFFAGMGALMEVLTAVSGSKAIVLFSNSPSAADEGDVQFAELSALAAAARCSIYPVHAAGLFAASRLGGPPMLARLANDTGGRFTMNTNDLSLAFARAQRDLGCQYTLGFYLSDDLEDRPRSIRIHVKPNGLRALHPERYMFRSDSAKLEAELSAAFMAPDMFDNGYISAYLFTLQPKTKAHWETLLAISFPVEFDQPDATVKIDFGAVVLQRETVIHSFNRRVLLRAREGVPATDRRFMFLEPIDLKPGEYELRVVMADAADKSRPEALRTNLDVPDITRKALMLVKPIFGRPRGDNVVVRGDGPSKDRSSIDPEDLARYDVVAAQGSFEPMLVQRMEDDDKIFSRNKACLVDRKKAQPALIERAVTSEGQEPIELPKVPMSLAKENKVLCQNVFEILPEDEIDDGRCIFEVTIADNPVAPTVRQSLPFAVTDEETQGRRPSSQGRSAND